MLWGQEQNSKQTETVKRGLENRARFSKGICKVLYLINNNLLDKFRLENNGIGIWQNQSVHHSGSQAELSQQCHTATE